MVQSVKTPLHAPARALFVLLMLGVSPVLAEPETSNEPAALAKLVSPKDENPSGTLINENNLSEYDQLVPDELLGPIKSGDISLTAFRSPRFTGTTFDTDWETKSQEKAAAAEALDVATADGFPRAFLYPATAKILEGASLSTEQQATQLLWNSQASTAARASFGVDFTLSEIGGTQGFSLRGSAQRIVPRRFRAEDKTGQLFRERVRIESPQLLKGLSWLTFRFINQQEDVVWAYSPAIKKTRQITSTNRSDPFLGSPLAVDDLFGFSGKIQTLEGSAISTTLALAPFFSLDALALKDEAGCLTISPERKKRSASGATLTVDGKDMVTSHVLPDMNFVPRQLVRVELLQGDPYSIYGRQVIYLDSETLFPFYKFVYDRTGSPEKVVITAAALAASANAQTKTVVPASSHIRSLSDKRAATVTYDRIRLCEQTDTEVTMTGFDPKGLSLPEEKPTPKSTVAPESHAVTPSSGAVVSSSESSAPLTYEDIP